MLWPGRSSALGGIVVVVVAVVVGVTADVVVVVVGGVAPMATGIASVDNAITTGIANFRVRRERKGTFSIVD